MFYHFDKPLIISSNPQLSQLQRSAAILFCMSISCVLRSFAWVLQIFIGRRIGGLNVITPEGLGVVTEGTV